MVNFLSINAFTPPVQTKPTFLVDDFEHWSSSAELQGWYQPKNPFTPSLSTDFHHSGKYSMKMVCPDAHWSGFTHYGDFTWDITGYDSLTFWFVGDSSHCQFYILFREQPVCCGPVYFFTYQLRTSNAGKMIRISLPRSVFIYGWGNDAVGQGKPLGNKIEEVNMMISESCGWGKDHTIYIDDIEWVPKRVVGTAGKLSVTTNADRAFGYNHAVPELSPARDFAPAAQTGDRGSYDLFDCRGVKRALSPSAVRPAGVYVLRAR